MRVAFNEISINNVSENIEEGKVLIEKFLLSYIKLRELGVDDSLISIYSLDGIHLSLDYPIQKWRNDYTIDKELRRVYIRLNDKLEIIQQDYGMEFICENSIKGFGCLEAYKNEGALISFSGDQDWRRTSIDGKVLEIVEDDIIEEQVSILNIFSEESVKACEQIIKNLIEKDSKAICTGEELWYSKTDLFPHLDFCENVKNQLFNIEKRHIIQIFKKLKLLNDYFKQWDGNEFDKNAISHCTPESLETLKKYKEEHTFNVSDGRKLVFSWHIRFTGNIAGRIFFVPDNASKKGIIGHIGNKLPTVLYN